MTFEDHNFQSLAFDFIKEIENMTDSQQVYDFLVATCKAFGADLVSIIDLDPFYANDTEKFNNWPVEWLERYRDEGYLRVDPLVMKALTTLEPFWWDDAIAEIPMNKTNMIVFNEAASINMKDGFLVTLHTQNGRTATLSLAGERLDRHPDAGPAMHMIGMYAYMRIKKLDRSNLQSQNIAAIRKLTERQLEIMKWAAEGKTNWEIGQILNISPNTVRNHIAKATESLEVGRRSEAINLIRGTLEI